MAKKSRAEVAIRGCGVVSAAGRDMDEVWQTWQQQKVNNIVNANFISAPCFYAGQRVNNLQFIPPVQAPTRTLELALFAIDQAVKNAEISLEELAHKRVGILVGTTVGCTFSDEDFYLGWRNNSALDEELFHNFFATNPAAYIQKHLGCSGPRQVITNACASGTDAIGLGARWLADGFCDLVIAGGADGMSRIACGGFESLRLISKDSCHPFSYDRQGLNLGEGAGFCVLQRRDDCQKPLGYLRGYAIAGDAYHPTAPHPEGRGLQQAFHQALAQTEYVLSDISCINAHGTGTTANDLAECKALSLLGVGDDTPLHSSKGITGHTLGAAGALEAIFTLEALRRGEVMGTVGCKQADPELARPVLLEGEKQTLSGNIGVSQSLAFGGSNSVLVIEGEL